jgi:carotenoid cleavage dioxygenase-like enzyme
MLNPVTTVPRSQPAWGRAILQPATEFAPTVLPVLEGKIPDGLQGVLYRNGPARLERVGGA